MKKRQVILRGFTLIELMVSIAIALLLILGVNVVFKTTSQTVGAGNGLLASVRDMRTVGATLGNDFAGFLAPNSGSSPDATKAPFFVIHSENMYAFRNFNDQDAAADRINPYHDVNLFSTASPAGQTFYNLTGVSSGPSSGANYCPVPLVNFRNHRVDRLAFFSNGLSLRQTGQDANQIYTKDSANTALVIYEHGAQPNNRFYTSPTSAAATWYNPGVFASTGTTGSAGLSNDNNFYSADWMLTRTAILLNPTPQSTNGFFADPGSGLGPFIGTSLSTGISGSTGGAIGTTYALQDCRIDLAAIGLSAYNSPTRVGGIASYASGGPNFGADWYNQVIGVASTSGNGPPAWRALVSPYILPDPALSVGTSLPKITSYGLAKASNALIRGCSQFIVEYTGNFYTKAVNGMPELYLHDKNLTYSAATGKPNGGTSQSVPKADGWGTLDFYETPGTQAGKSLAHPRALRWYGFPRSATPYASTPTVPAGGANQPSTSNPARIDPGSGDVMPLQFVYSTFNSAWASAADAERIDPRLVSVFSSDPKLWHSMDPTVNYQYTAAWGPDVRQPLPRLIRITIGLDDHEGRLKQPQMFEYIFALNQ